MKRTSILFLFIALSPIACGKEKPLACTMPAGLTAVGAVAAANQCTAGIFLTCAYSNGDHEDCISNDPSACPGPSPLVPTATTTSCNNQCSGNEYGVACGGPLQPPAGCHSATVSPAEITYYCCPCL